MTAQSIAQFLMRRRSPKPVSLQSLQVWAKDVRSGSVTSREYTVRSARFLNEEIAIRLSRRWMALSAHHHLSSRAVHDLPPIKTMRGVYAQAANEWIRSQFTDASNNAASAASSAAAGGSLSDAELNQFETRSESLLETLRTSSNALTFGMRDWCLAASRVAASPSAAAATDLAAAYGILNDTYYSVIGFRTLSHHHSFAHSLWTDPLACTYYLYCC